MPPKSWCTFVMLFLPHFRCSARVVAVRRITGPDGIAQQTSYAIQQPGCPPQQLTRTVIIRPAGGRPLDPNLPPTYEQAVTGKDRGVKLEEGGSSSSSPNPEGAMPSAPPPRPPGGFPPPPPPAGPAFPQPPPYTQAPPRPAPSAPTLEEDNENDDIDADDRRLLLS